MPSVLDRSERRDRSDRSAPERRDGRPVLGLLAPIRLSGLEAYVTAGAAE